MGVTDERRYARKENMPFFTINEKTGMMRKCHLSQNFDMKNMKWEDVIRAKGLPNYI